jgi:hypothetical protein
MTTPLLEAWTRQINARKCLDWAARLALLLLFASGSPLVLASSAQSGTTTNRHEPKQSVSAVEDLIGAHNAKDQATIQRAQDIASSVAATDWLGALSPLAISPFFGMACLSGIATFGPDWIRDRSTLFDPASPLANPYLFWTMIVLTVVTSLPRFSKVSKPVALLADRLESYSVVLILVCMRLFGGLDESAVPVAVIPVQVAGIEALPLDIVLAGFAWLNLIVVGTIKLFFEFLIWLTPIPALDAAFEVASKFISAALTMLYCISPFAAAMLNIVLLVLCSSVFFWVSRRMHYYLHVLAIPWLWRLMGRHTIADVKDQRLFLAGPWQSWPSYSKVRLVGSEEDGWIVTGNRLGWFARKAKVGPSKIVVEKELLCNKAKIDDGSGSPLTVYFPK